MITKRIIPCLDVKDGRVVKGVNFSDLADVTSPVKLAKFYSECGADELVFYDITASAEGRALFTDVLCEVPRVVYSIFLTIAAAGASLCLTTDRCHTVDSLKIGDLADKYIALPRYYSIFERKLRRFFEIY